MGMAVRDSAQVMWMPSSSVATWRTGVNVFWGFRRVVSLSYDHNVNKKYVLKFTHFRILKTI